MKALSSLFICVLALSLSACGSVKLFDEFDSNPRMDASLDSVSEASVDDSVTIYADDGAPQEGMYIGSSMTPMTPPAPLPMIQTQGMSMGDPSVTIYPLPGEPLMGMAGMPYGSGVAAADAVIYFKHGSSRLGSGDVRKLSQAADAARFAPVNRVRVEGHASRRAETSDPVKSSILNLKESMNRAFAVSKTLIQKGVPAEKIQTTAFGDTVPTTSEREQRRVDVITGAGY